MMKRRRRNQPKLTSLSLLARFLNHACEQEKVTQATLAQKLDTSTATVSRWFRDDMKPTDEDLEGISKVLNIPVENFMALRMLDNIGPSKPMLATTGAFYFMALGTRSTLLLAGITMVAGMIHIRKLNLKNKRIILYTLDPNSKASARLEKKIDPFNLGSSRLSWLTALSIGITQAKRHKTKVLVWARNNLHIDKERRIGELVANDWIAIESPLPNEKGSFKTSFYNDKDWESSVYPLLNHLDSTHGDKENKLIWDSSWERKMFSFKKILKHNLPKI